MDQTDLLMLSNKYDGLKDLTKSRFEEINSKYPVLVSPYITKQIQERLSEGIALQFLPNPDEIVYNEGLGAFFPEEKHHYRNLIMKYPNRCIIYTTSHCFANCRHCSRKEKWFERYSFSKTDFDEAMLILKKYKHIEEVIITGGDPFTLSNNNIKYILDSVSNLSHVKVIRIGTRAFTSNPDRIDQELCSILKNYKSLILLTQINHPDEFTNESISSINSIQMCGIPILNQSVLLRGINDNYSTLKDLYTKCVVNRVIPYYLFHCFNVKGAQCYRTNVTDGIKLVNSLVGNIGGFWIPRYTIIHEETGVKVPVAPNGLLAASNNNITIKDFKNREMVYF